MPQIQITCDTPDSSIYYTLDGSIPDPSKNLYSNVFEADLGSTVKAIGIKEGYDSSDIVEFEVVYKVGDEVVKDGITSVCVYDVGSQQSWGRYLFVDKNHDLSYYISGSDYVDSDDYNQSPGTFGYEWGGISISTDINSQTIGDGLSNTNSLISKNLTPYTSGWRVLWDMVEQFRSSHSNDWFVPTLNELKEVYNQRSYLENLSISTNPFYWSSSELGSDNACYVLFSSGYSNYRPKNLHYFRSRLCFYL